MKKVPTSINASLRINGIEWKREQIPDPYKEVHIALYPVGPKVMWPVDTTVLVETIQKMVFVLSRVEQDSQGVGDLFIYSLKEIKS